MRRFKDERGNEVRLTDERLRHLMKRHPEMAFQMHRFSETLARPDVVRPSGSNQTVHLYYRLYPDLRGRNRYLCLVVKRSTSYSFILTAYLARKIKGK
ncbi:MAG: PBECR2 nuclease fold domain-containing protein [Gemmatimonadota bacterium]|nr:PBECR2 nuclease fold domain-containing protein [Gemmatimonadota bacterium]